MYKNVHGVIYIQTIDTTCVLELFCTLVLVAKLANVLCSIFKPGACRRLVRAWFLIIASVRECLYACLFACVCVCASAPEAINN